MMRSIVVANHVALRGHVMTASPPTNWTTIRQWRIRQLIDSRIDIIMPSCILAFLNFILLQTGERLSAVHTLQLYSATQRTRHCAGVQLDSQQ